MSKIKGYSKSFKLIHALTGFLILGMIVLGLSMKEFDVPFKYQLYGYHKSTGIIVMVLSSIFLLIKLFTINPEKVNYKNKKLGLLAKFTKIGLFFSMISFPLSGILMSLSGGKSISFFGFFDLPFIIEKNEELQNLMSQTHGTLVYITITLLILHISGVVYHKFIMKDDELRTMI